MFQLCCEIYQLLCPWWADVDLWSRFCEEMKELQEIMVFSMCWDVSSYSGYKIGRLQLCLRSSFVIWSIVFVPFVVNHFFNPVYYRQPVNSWSDLTLSIGPVITTFYTIILNSMLQMSRDKRQSDKYLCHYYSTRALIKQTVTNKK